MAKAAVRATGKEIKVKSEQADEELHALVSGATAATAEDVAAARALPAPTHSRVKAIHRGALALFTEGKTQQVLRANAAALAPLGLDAVGAIANATALAEQLDRYERLQNSADRQYQALLARMERFRLDEGALAGVAHGAAPGSPLADALAGYFQSRAVIRGTSRGVATRKKNQKAKTKSAT